MLNIEERWFGFFMDGATMEKINLPFFYQLGSQLNPLGKMKAEPQNRIDIWIATLTLRNNIFALLNWAGGLKVCYAGARALLDAINEVQTWVGNLKAPGDWTKQDASIDWKFQQIIDKAKNFETVLSEELLTLSAYCATQKGIYSTSDLIDHAERVFPPSVLEKLSEPVVQEVAHGGRCLAFDIPTAAGFHMLPECV
jgi:hypothetical protein